MTQQWALVGAQSTTPAAASMPSRVACDPNVKRQRENRATVGRVWVHSHAPPARRHSKQHPLPLGTNPTHHNLVHHDHTHRAPSRCPRHEQVPELFHVAVGPSRPQAPPRGRRTRAATRTHLSSRLCAGGCSIRSIGEVARVARAQAWASGGCQGTAAPNERRIGKMQRGRTPPSVSGSSPGLGLVC